VPSSPTAILFVSTRSATSATRPVAGSTRRTRLCATLLGSGRSRQAPREVLGSCPRTRSGESDGCRKEAAGRKGQGGDHDHEDDRDEGRGDETKAVRARKPKAPAITAEQVAERAYYIWAEGSGDDPFANWIRAEQELQIA
jgi:hypothetical protein